MKPLNVNEIETLVQELDQCVGARVQEVISSNSGLGLGLYQRGSTFWLWVDMNVAAPMLLMLETQPPVKKAKLPVALFLNAHAKHLKFSGVQQRHGRVVELRFGDYPEPLKMEIRLFPHGGNVIVTKGEKHISFFKVKALNVDGEFKVSQPEARSLAALRKEWLNRFEKKEVAKEDEIKKLIQKKKEGLKRLREDAGKKKEFFNYLALGEWLKEHQSLRVPLEFVSYLKNDLSLAETIEATFQMAKLLRAKYEEGLRRIERMQAEIAELESGNYSGATKKQMPKKVQPKKAKFRTLALEGAYEAYLGKSGKDNLALLRQAQPWDLWLHLRDLPGAHAIIRKTKSAEIPEAILLKTIHWLVRETAAKSFSTGDIVEIQMQEVRFVRPIKGDTHGRVTVQNARYRRVRLGKL